MITVEKVLTTPAFNGAKVVAGKFGLKNYVKLVTVAEVPDAANWLEGGELICTTAYFISKEVKYQILWIKSLKENGAVALAIKTDRFLGKIPISIIDIANSLNFPIIEMPSDTTWPNVIESVMNPLLNEKIKTLKRAEEIHTKLTSLLLENESVKKISDVISLLVENPIIVEDARLNHIATSDKYIYETELSDEAINMRLSNSIRNKIKSTNFYQDVMRNKEESSFEFILEIEDKQITNIITPIVSRKVTYGFITLLNVSENISEIDFIALNHGASAIALQLMKETIHNQAMQNNYIALVDDLVHGRIHSDLVNEYIVLDNVKSTLMCTAVVNLKLYNADDEVYTWENNEITLINLIKKHLLNFFEQVIIGNNELTFIIIVFQSKLKSAQMTKYYQKKLINILNQCRDNKLIKNYSGGIGSSYTELIHLNKSFKEAETALSITNSFSKTNNVPILLYEELGLHRIISMIYDFNELNIFCEEFLGDLCTHDEKNNDVLKETLYMYLKCNGIVKDTANNLFIHSNTVRYRLNKIQKILKHDLNTLE